MVNGVFNEVLNRRQFSLSIATSVPVWTLAAGATEVRAERSRVTLAVSGKSSFYYLPLTIAEQLGYFEQEVLELEMVEFPSALKA